MTEKRKIGSLVDVTPVGLGCMGFSHAYGAPTERKEAVGMIRKAYEMGYDFFDTAECYTGINADGSTSYNEELVGEALKDVRKLPDSDVVRQLAAQFPLEETFRKSGEHEFFCRLGRGIDVRGMDGTSNIHGNGIYYFADWKALSFVYKDMSISPYQVVYLGEFSDDVRGILSRTGNKVKARMEAAEVGR